MAMEILPMKAIDTEVRRSLLFIQTQFWSIPGSLAALQGIYKANIVLTAKDTMTVCDQVMTVIFFFIFLFNWNSFHNINKSPLGLFCVSFGNHKK